MSSLTSKKKAVKDPASQTKRKSLFDHIKAIRQVKDPNYYNSLSEDDRKSFNHFMILRALSMDASIVENMAQLYPIFDKIPSPQFYTLLVALVPNDFRFYPWIKSKRMHHNKELLEYVAKRFGVARYEANEYVTLLLRSENGQAELVNICRSFGLNDKEIDALFEEKKEDE